MYAAFSVKWSVSRARDTEGYPVCTFRGDGIKGRCFGGGYDMIGAALAEVVMKLFPDFFNKKRSAEELEHLQKSYYGLSPLPDMTLTLRSDCGRDCVERIVYELLDATVTWEYLRDRKGRPAEICGVVIESAYKAMSKEI